MQLKLFNFATHTLIMVMWVALIVGVFFVVPQFSFLQHERVINVLSWGGIFDPKTLDDYYTKTGVKVRVNYYTTNEELLVNLKATRGRGYDLVVPSDYAVKILRQERLLKKLDKQRLPFVKNINPLLLSHSFDPENQYSLPYMWEIFGLGYDKAFFKDRASVNWDLIFKRPDDFTITMMNDPIEIITLVAYYLYGANVINAGQLTQKQVDCIKTLLIAQRSWVEAYTDFRPDYYLLSKNCPIVVTCLSSILRGMEQSKNLDFVIPGNKVMISIENVAIPATCTDDALVYDFLNFAYQKAIMKDHFTTYYSLPATLDVLKEITLIDEVKRLLSLSKEAFEKKVLFFAPLMPESAMHNLWVDIKSR